MHFALSAPNRQIPIRSLPLVYHRNGGMAMRPAKFDGRGGGFYMGFRVLRGAVLTAGKTAPLARGKFRGLRAAARGSASGLCGL